jgi:hypothetical protein
MPRRRHKITYKGGKILGSGADGCVFSAAGWPCETPLAGYDPNDPTLVSKLIPTSDNEDAIIRLVQSIVPDKLDHIIGHIGTCTPASSKDVITAQSRAQFDENKNQLAKIRHDYYVTRSDAGGKPNACERVKGYDSLRDTLKMAEYGDDPADEDDSVPVKLLINKRYSSTLHDYMKNLPKDTKDFHNIFEAFAEYVKVLELLAEGRDNKRVLNVDLHGANIFLNTTPTGKLIMGLADFGRCALQRNASEYARYIDYILMYGVTYGTAFGFPVIPFEYKIYSYMDYFKRKYVSESKNIDTFLNYFCWNLFRNDKNSTTPWSIFSENIMEHFVTNYFGDFAELMLNIDIKTEKTNPVFQEFCQLMFLDRFNSLGAMQILYYDLSYKDKNYKQIPQIMRGISSYLSGHNTTPIQTNTEFARFVHLYFDSCIYPHKAARTRAAPNKPTMEDYIYVMKAAPKLSDQLIQILDRPVTPTTPKISSKFELTTNSSPKRVAIPPTYARLPPRRGPAPPIVLGTRIPPVVTKAIVPVNTTRKTTPKYLTRGAIARDPSLGSRIMKPFDPAAAREASREATLNIIKGAKTGPTRQLFKKTRKQRKH